VTTVGPHRDDVELLLGGRDTRTQASQGEQRTLALALRLAVHLAANELLGEPPLLLLDDVFSELDPNRARRLVNELPAGQALVTTASPLPEGVRPALILDVEEMLNADG
jgi:DNA replication and repair protein RecF